MVGISSGTLYKEVRVNMCKWALHLVASDTTLLRLYRQLGIVKVLYIHKYEYISTRTENIKSFVGHNDLKPRNLNFATRFSDTIVFSFGDEGKSIAS